MENLTKREKEFLWEYCKLEAETEEKILSFEATIRAVIGHLRDEHPHLADEDYAELHAQKSKVEYELAELKDKIETDEMGDELNAAEADRYEAHALGEIAQFVETVREMRAAQCEYFRTRDKAIMKKSMALEKQVDDAIKKDDYVLWALQHLPKQ